MKINLNQRAGDFLSEVVTNLGKLLDEGANPSSFIIDDITGIEIEIRINKIPGFFEREQIISEKLK